MERGKERRDGEAWKGGGKGRGGERSSTRWKRKDNKVTVERGEGGDPV